MKTLVALGGEPKVSTVGVAKNMQKSAEVKASGEEAQANDIYEAICDYKNGFYSPGQRDKATTIL